MAEATFKLHAFPKPDANSPSDSFFCQKLECYLRLAGVTTARYSVVAALPFFQPKGKLPALTLTVPNAPDEYMVDSHFIIRTLTERGILPDVDSALGLSSTQRAETRAWQAWTEDIVYLAIVHSRWSRPANYSAITATMPRPRAVVAWIFSRRILPALYQHGIGRHTDAERDTLMREWTDALAARLAQGPSTADAIIGSLLTNSASLKSNPEFNSMWTSDPPTKAYAKRCVERFFPEYRTVLAELSANDTIVQSNVRP